MSDKIQQAIVGGFLLSLSLLAISGAIYLAARW